MPGVVRYVRNKELEMVRTKIGVAVFIGIVALAFVAWGDILDPEGPDHPILSPLAPSLHEVDVDVILGKAAVFEVSNRARLARLDGFESSPGRNWGNYWQDVWTEGFERGLIGAILAVAPTEEEEPQPPAIKKEIARCRTVPAQVEDITCDFLDEWLPAKAKGKRVFIAFTRSDLAIATTIGEVLRAQGYKVFTYLRGEQRDPWAHPDFVGAVFANADHRLVIDTRNSRGSEGVQFEASCVQALMPKRVPKDTRYLDFLTPRQ